MESVSLNYISELNKVLASFPHAAFDRLVTEFKRARNEERTIFVMGNGGSGATASHWVADVVKGCSYGMTGKRYKMLCLNDNMPTILAYSNDVSYEQIFAEQLKNFCKPQDLVIGISGSGNSKNVVNAIAYANEVGAVTAGLLGYQGGKLLSMVQIPIHINVNDMQLSEDLHLIVVHMLMKALGGGC